MLFGLKSEDSRTFKELSFKCCSALCQGDIELDLKCSSALSRRTLTLELSFKCCLVISRMPLELDLKVDRLKVGGH